MDSLVGNSLFLLFYCLMLGQIIVSVKLTFLNLRLDFLKDDP